MNDCWHQFGRFLWWGGTLEGAVFIVAMGAVGGVITGVILLAIKFVWMLPRAVKEGWNRALAEDRAKRVAKQRIQPDDSLPAPPTGDIPPTSDI
jgi:hypothetical protein